MIKKNNKLLIFLSTIYLSAFVIITPNWLRLNGVAPCWPVILLLPVSLKNSPFIASIAAIAMGIFIDSFTISDVSYIPPLLILSLALSQYGLRNKKIEYFFNIGLIAIFGTAFVGLSIWAQKIIMYSVLRNNWFHSWSLNVLISEVIMTGLVAPFFSSWLLLASKKN